MKKNDYRRIELKPFNFDMPNMVFNDEWEYNDIIDVHEKANDIYVEAEVTAWADVIYDDGNGMIPDGLEIEKFHIELSNINITEEDYTQVILSDEQMKYIIDEFKYEIKEQLTK